MKALKIKGLMIGVSLFHLFTFSPLPLQAKGEAGLKPRLVVCTDIAPADVEPDDNESMVRLLTYADLFEIEALITSVGWNCDPYPKEWAEYLQRAIEAYRARRREWRTAIRLLAQCRLSQRPSCDG